MKHISLIALFVAIALLPELVMAASATGTGDAKAKIVTPVTATKTQDLNFGSMLGEANTVTVSHAGARTATTSSALVNDGNTPTAGRFTVTGPNNQPITVSLPANATVTSSTNSMTISNFTSDKSGSQSLDGTGNLTINIGADLAVTANQPEGDYTGTYQINITY